MNSFLTPFKESYLIKICIAIVLFFYSLFSFGQVDKNSDLYKHLNLKTVLFLKELLTSAK